MTLQDWVRNRPPESIALWTVAAIFVGFALADVPLLGIEPDVLAVLAAFFAASTAVYDTRSNCNSV